MPVNEFNEMKDLEVMTFRRNILKECQEAIDERDSRGLFSQALYVYPPDLESSEELPKHIQERVDRGKIWLGYWV